MKKIIIKKMMQTGSTLGAYMYAYLIQFPHNDWKYSFNATEEGITYAAKYWKEAGFEIEWQEK